MAGRAVEVAVSLGRELGLDVARPQVLGVVPNAVVHLAPSPVVARVPTAFALVPRDVDWVGRQLAAAAYLADRDVPVAAPSTLVPAGPHVRDGVAIGLWEHVDHDRARPLDIPEAVRALRAMQDALVDYPGSVPHFARLDELAAVLDVLSVRGLVTPSQLELLVAAHAWLSGDLAELDVPVQPIHGDAHLGNVLRTPAGPLWSDFDTFCAGPPELDVLSFSLRVRLHPADAELRAALQAYGSYDHDVAAAVEPYLALYLCCWTAACLAGAPAMRPLFERRLGWLRRFAASR